MHLDLAPLTQALARIVPVQRLGRIAAVAPGSVRLGGLAHHARIGDLVDIGPGLGEIIALHDGQAIAMSHAPTEGLAIGDPVRLLHDPGIAPADAWVGRIVDAFGAPLDGRPLLRGPSDVPLRAMPPPATTRRALGARLATGLGLFDTMLPLARGQRLGIFAGSGVGKSSLLADLARGVEADVVVLALIGERGRELRHFTDHVLGPEGMARSVVVAATSDCAPLVKRRAAWTAMAIAESYRDQGRHVLLLVDSLTRFAEAHREIALTAGETPSLRAFPPSTAALISALAERAGPGGGGEIGTGDITAVFTVLVAGSDMDEPVADIARGILDGHVVLSREIAERGRFPAVDVRRSVSRSLPDAASPEENRIIARARALLARYESSEAMIRTGLYTRGSDPVLDEAIEAHPALDAFFSARQSGPEASFAALAQTIGAEAPGRSAKSGLGPGVTAQAGAAVRGPGQKKSGGSRRQPVAP